MNVLITGGTGFIGSRLALRCLERGDGVRVLGQQNTPAEGSNRELIAKRGAVVSLGSVTDNPDLPGLFRDVDVVFHLAATQHEMNVPDQRFWDVNVTGTQNVLDAAVAAGVSRVIHGSTIGVYGVPTTVIDEDTPCEPDNIYGVTKLEGEKLALSYRDRITVVVVRIPEVYGPGDRRLIKLFRPISKNKFFIIGRGDNLHHLIFIDDLIDGFLQAAEHDGAANRLFLLAGREPVSTKEMVATIAEQFGVKPPRMHAPMLPFLVLATLMETGLRPLGIQPPLHRRRLDFFRKSFSLSAENAHQAFGFDPRTDFAEGARQTAEYYRENGDLS
jgi:nucleoside-diphosphate-sugar epimerase